MSRVILFITLACFFPAVFGQDASHLCDIQRVVINTNPPTDRATVGCNNSISVGGDTVTNFAFPVTDVQTAVLAQSYINIANAAVNANNRVLIRFNTPQNGAVCAVPGICRQAFAIQGLY